MCVWVSVCVCVYVCLERDWQQRDDMCVYVVEKVCVCVRACVCRLYRRCVCVCVISGERERGGEGTER